MAENHSSLPDPADQSTIEEIELGTLSIVANHALHGVDLEMVDPAGRGFAVLIDPPVVIDLCVGLLRAHGKLLGYDPPVMPDHGLDAVILEITNAIGDGLRTFLAPTQAMALAFRIAVAGDRLRPPQHAVT